MATIQKYLAPGVFDPPGYSQAIKVTGVDHDPGRRPRHPDYLIEIEAIAVI